MMRVAVVTETFGPARESDLIPVAFPVRAEPVPACISASCVRIQKAVDLLRAAVRLALPGMSHQLPARSVNSMNARILPAPRLDAAGPATGRNAPAW
jgi:hypothetical protein